MRSEVIVVDLVDPVFTKTIRSRQNDKNGLKIIVHLKENGRIVKLTGYVEKFEATNNKDGCIRDDATIVDVNNGTIEYVLSDEAVSTPDEWTAYFVIENTTERTSTPDIRIVLRRDAKEGNIKIEHYISEFDKALEDVAGYRKEIDDTTARITELTTLIHTKNVQVPRITDDTGGATISVSDTAKNILDEIKNKGKGMNTVYCAGGVQGNTPNNKSWRGFAFLNSNSYGIVIAKDFQNKLFSNYLDNGTWIGWVEHVIKEDFVGWSFTAQGFKRTSDIDWTKLETTGVENVADRTPKYKKVEILFLLLDQFETQKM